MALVTASIQMADKWLTSQPVGASCGGGTSTCLADLEFAPLFPGPCWPLSAITPLAVKVVPSKCPAVALHICNSLSLKTLFTS